MGSRFGNFLVYSPNPSKIKSVESFSAKSRPLILQNATVNQLDVLIIGGGITGAGILLESSRRGLKTLLVEQNDFGSGTSSASSKLIHGGLRYLEIGDFHQVFESCKDRKRLLKLAPELVKPLPFLFPIFKGQRRNLWTIYAGTIIYYILALFRNLGFPQKNSASKTLRIAPSLKKENLTGSVQYFDASTIDSKLTLSTIKTSLQFGGNACNHAKVIRYLKDKNKIVGAVIRDQISNLEYEIRAKRIVNAVGPWTDPLRKEFLNHSDPKVRLTKGTHIIVKGNPFQISTAIVMLAPSDGRVMFLIPWLGDTMIGTTDTDYHGPPSDVSITSEDIHYLLTTAKFYFPSVAIQQQEILSTFAGLRCLQPVNKENPSDVTREEILFSDAEGLLSVAGGKLTSFLSMSERIMNLLIEKNPEWKSLSTHKLTSFVSVSPYLYQQLLDDEYFNHLIDTEMAATIRDLLQFRSLRYYFSKDHGTAWMETAAKCLQAKLGYAEEEIHLQKNEYLNLVKQQQFISSSEP